MNKRIGPWRPAYQCAECKEAVSNHQRMYCDGVCPHCGHTSGSTILDTTMHQFRIIREGVWWFPWTWKTTIQRKEWTQTHKA